MSAMIWLPKIKRLLINHILDSLNRGSSETARRIPQIILTPTRAFLPLPSRVSMPDLSTACQSRQSDTNTLFFPCRHVRVSTWRVWIGKTQADPANSPKRQITSTAGLRGNSARRFEPWRKACSGHRGKEDEWKEDVWRDLSILLQHVRVWLGPKRHQQSQAPSR